MTYTHVDEARAAVEFLDACLRDLHTQSEGRALDPDEQAKWDEGFAARSEAAEFVAAYEARQEQVRQLIALKPETIQPGEDRGVPNMIVRKDPFDLSELRYDATPQEIRSIGLRAVEAADFPSDASRDEAERTVRSTDPSVAIRYAATGGDLYMRAFSKAAMRGLAVLNPEESAAIERAASLTDNAGGYAVPFTLDPTIILTNDGTANPFRQISTIKKITTDTWNGVSSAGVTASWDAEAAEVSDDAPTLAQPSITPYKEQAFVPFSVEIGDDWANLQADIFALFVDAFDRLEGAAFATGSGSAQPFGIVTALAGGSSEINVAGTETFAVTDVYATVEALGPRWRDKAVWVANLATYNDIRQFDTGGGASLWTRLDAARPGLLLGRPAYESSDMDSSSNINAAATENNYIMVFGDFSNYYIVDRVGMSVELVPHMFHTGNNRPSGQRGLIAWKRVGADSVNDAAFTLLDLPTTA